MRKLLVKKLKRLLGRGQPVDDPNRHEGDGMNLKARNVSWMGKPEFQSAYQKGIHSGHQWRKDPASKGLRVACMPTGQGLIIKPPSPKL